MTIVKIKNHSSIILDEAKALLLNKYTKLKYIKILNRDKDNLEIEIISKNEIVKHSILN